MVYILIIIILFILLIAFNKRAVPVFLYHQVNSISNVTPELFEEHLKIIKKYNIETVTISEYYNNINKNSMLLTFDDGYYDNFKYVFPLLKKYNMKATIFLNTLYIMDKRENEPEIKDNNTVNLEAMKKYIKSGSATINQYMSWEEIKEMYDSGLVDFQAHSHKHTAIFTGTKIEGLTKKDKMEPPELYLYRELENNYPVFAKRGEYSGKAKIVKREF
ncbi:polysaccharide deacetylase family protein, partial [Fusobacterium nucleatum]|uniref:polysaccharide deacetylase family protein n=1 Tax=Fusobacterium nucleatum TaxID=851 RepID=UPI001F52AA44